MGSVYSTKRTGNKSVIFKRGKREVIFNKTKGKMKVLHLRKNGGEIERLYSTKVRRK